MAAVPDRLVAGDISTDAVLAFCKATADAQRLDILRVLRDESFGVLELCHIFDSGQPGMSHHLKVLAGAALLQTRREGNSIFYRRSLITVTNALGDLVSSFFDAIDRIPLTLAVTERMGEVYQERARNSRQFFEKNADRLKENQALIADFSQYSGCVRDLIANEQIPASARVLEIGPGESQLLGWLAGTFDAAVALDNTAEMLARSRSTLSSQVAGKVDFQHGEPADLIRRGERFDLAVLNMVLHHLPSPAQLFREASLLLNPGGRLLIIDLRPHDQDWARDICGDLWLGFEPHDLDKWAGDAGLSRSQSVYLGLKNGFQVQVRLFLKP
ncbi:MAG: metalloregulator ArsR/SmtB family transcription factor [Pseudomonadota bacterium]